MLRVRPRAVHTVRENKSSLGLVGLVGLFAIEFRLHHKISASQFQTYYFRTTLKQFLVKTKQNEFMTPKTIFESLAMFIDVFKYFRSEVT